MCASRKDNLSIVKQKARTDERKNVCRSSATLRIAYTRWNNWQYKDQKKGREVPRFWQEHFQKVRGMVEDAMGEADGKDVAVVLGAGICNEVPLRRMCESFNRIVLVDADPKAMEFAVKMLRSADLAKRVETLEGDVSTITGPLVERAESIIHDCNDAEEAEWQLISLINAVAKTRAPARALQVPDGSSDFLFSSDVLPYMLTMPVSWIDEQYEKKFGKSFGLDQHPLLNRLMHAVVKSHLHELTRIMKPGSRGFIETCIYYGPTIEDKAFVAMEDPVTGGLTYLGVPHFGYDLQVRKMVELWDLLGNLMHPELLAFKMSSKDWTVVKRRNVVIQTPVGPIPTNDGIVFQAIRLKKRES